MVHTLGGAASLIGIFNGITLMTGGCTLDSCWTHASLNSNERESYVLLMCPVIRSIERTNNACIGAFPIGISAGRHVYVRGAPARNTGTRSVSQMRHPNLQAAMFIVISTMR